MNCVCPHCDTELELVDVESYQMLPDSIFMNMYYSYSCPTCGRKYHSGAEYQKMCESDLHEDKE